MEAIVFCGIPGSGKSTFYRERFFHTHIRLNLDMLRTRHRERILLEACLVAQQPFVVDNTNVTVTQRARYIAAARAAGIRVVGYYFPCGIQEAVARNRERQGKQRIPDAAVYAMLARLQPPTHAEGFDVLYSVSIPKPCEFLVEELHRQL
jgi:predicted kinase